MTVVLAAMAWSNGRLDTLPLVFEIGLPVAAVVYLLLRCVGWALAGFAAGDNRP